MGDLSDFTPPPHPKGISLDGQLVKLEAIDPENHAKSLFDANTEEGGEDN